MKVLSEIRYQCGLWDSCDFPSDIDHIVQKKKSVTKVWFRLFIRSLAALTRFVWKPVNKNELTDSELGPSARSRAKKIAINQSRPAQEARDIMNKLWLFIHNSGTRKSVGEFRWRCSSICIKSLSELWAFENLLPTKVWLIFLSRELNFKVRTQHENVFRRNFWSSSRKILKFHAFDLVTLFLAEFLWVSQRRQRSSKFSKSFDIRALWASHERLA